MPTPRSTAEYYQRQQRLIAQLLLALRRVWRRMEPGARWQEQYEDDGVGAQLLMLVAAAQVAAARDADNYIANVLTELSLVPSASPGVVATAGFAGVTGDGRQVETLLAQAIPRAGQSFNRLRRDEIEASLPEQPDQMSDVAWESLVRERRQSQATLAAIDLDRAAQEALADAGKWLEAVAASILIDTARAAESAATTARPEVGGYVRMLNPPSCSRCVVLAGRFYRWNEGFDRHPPTCDCRHIPASEAIAGDLTVNPDSYFHSLTREEQDKTFTKAGAQAIRDGADINQVVNARRGMQKAQVFGRDVVVTSEGTTRRGFAYARLPGTRANDTRRRGEKYRRTTAVRLMPESLYEIAGDDRDEAIRLLKLHGFIL